MVAVYSLFWTANPDVVKQQGAPLFYVTSEYDLVRMFAVNPAWRVKETRIRAIANLPADAPQCQPIIEPTQWRDVGHAVDVYQ